VLSHSATSLGRIGPVSRTNRRSSSPPSRSSSPPTPAGPRRAQVQPQALRLPLDRRPAATEGSSAARRMPTPVPGTREHSRKPRSRVRQSQRQRLRRPVVHA
jgi:hypothetical protein